MRRVQLTGGTAACAVGGGGLPHLLPVLKVAGHNLEMLKVAPSASCTFLGLVLQRGIGAGRAFLWFLGCLAG